MVREKRPKGTNRAPHAPQARASPAPYPKVVFRPILVASSPRDTDGRLVLVNNHLVSVIVRLTSGEHGKLTGWWSVEATFAPDAPMPGKIFPTLEEVAGWVRECLTQPGYNHGSSA